MNKYHILKTTVFIFFLQLIIIPFSLKAQAELHKRVKIILEKKEISALARLGIETDHGDLRPGAWLITDLSVREIAKVQQAGFKTEIIIDDASAYYKAQNNHRRADEKKLNLAGGCLQNTGPDYKVPSHFRLGSMGGYFTYDEMIMHLDSMAILFPGLITIKQPLNSGRSIEGRPVYFLKISDNPGVSEPEPQILYSALHHAREPQGLSQLIYYMWYLLENYASDPQVKSIVNNNELYFVPCVNPDGYIFNVINNPDGGGLWRKNLRDNLDGEFGVDLNRNYSSFWGFDDTGSSPLTAAQTYRGSAPASEPEVQSVVDFVKDHDFKIAFNYHSFGNLLIYPWGYQPSFYTPDSSRFVNFAKLMTKYNDFTHGTADQTVGYIVNGNSDDWMYGDVTAKPKIFALTPEVGDGIWGFWPPSDEIIPLSQACMFQNITAARLLGKYAVLEDVSRSVIPSLTGYISYDITELGLDSTGTYTVSLSAITPNIISTGAQKTYSSLIQLKKMTDSISFKLKSTGMIYGEEVKFALQIDNGNFTIADTLIKTFGTPVVAFSHPGNSMNGWNTATDWNISNTQYYSPPSSITDSPQGDYSSNTFNTLRLLNPVNLTNAVSASLSFYTKWFIEPNYDYAQVSASVNGTAWTPLCGKYTRPGALTQDAGNPLYDGFQRSWVKEEMSLDDYVGQNIWIRFLLVSDGRVEHDGFYFDDLEINKILPGGVGIEEKPGAHALFCEPNPASDYTNIYYSLSSPMAKTNLLIQDMAGRVVKKIALPPGSNSVRVDTRSLAGGIYLYNLESGNIKTAQGKLMIVGKRD